MKAGRHEIRADRTSATLLEPDFGNNGCTAARNLSPAAFVSSETSFGNNSSKSNMDGFISEGINLLLLIGQSLPRHEPEKEGLLGNRFYFCFQGSLLGLTERGKGTGEFHAFLDLLD